MTIEQKPMGCCGMLSASGFTYDENDDKLHEDDREEFFDRIFEAQQEYDRSCALISLSSRQPAEIEHAKKRGFKIIHEFFNPNSGNTVYLMTHTLWKTYDEYLNYSPKSEEEEEGVPF
jgi:hypothetical protein